MAERLIQPRTMVIEGRPTLVVEKQRPIPATLQLMLEGGRDATQTWLPLSVVASRPLHLKGARAECMAQEHRLQNWVEGFHKGSDGVVRHLMLQACSDCGSVCVRDRSTDTLSVYSGDPRDVASAGRRPLRRKDHVIGWYTGARPRQRVYT